MLSIFVGNMPYTMTEDDLQGMFEEFGEVESTKIIKDMETSRSKGFGFVKMMDNDSAKKAIKSLDGKEINGRNIKVNESENRPKTPTRY